MLDKCRVDASLAARINDSFLALDRDLNELMRGVEKQMSTEEFPPFRRAMGEVLGILYLDVMKPLYVKFPEIKPEGMP